MAEVDVTLLLRQVRSEVRGLLADIDPHSVPNRPLRVEDHDDGTLRIWSDLDSLSVHTMRDQGQTVFISAGRRIEWRSGTALQWRPDWCALTADEARTLGLALLAAAGDVETADDVMADAKPERSSPAPGR